MNVSILPARDLSSEHVALWSELQRADARLDSPFFRPEMTQLLAQVCDNVEVALLKDRGELVGFFPFQRESGNVGQPICGELSDMQGIVARRGLSWDIKQLLKLARLKAWHFNHLLASQEGFQSYHKFLDDSPYMDLRQGYDKYYQQRRQAGSSLLSQGERKRRKLQREIGEVRFEYHTRDEKVLDCLIAWKRKQLREARYRDVFCSTWVCQLCRLISLAESEGFCGRLSALYAGEELIAVHLGMQSFEVLSSWIPTFDPTYGKYSPGVILHMELAKVAAAHGVARIDLGRGYNPLKKSLMSGSIPVAVGTVDLRPLRRLLGESWYLARKAVYASPLKHAPMRWYRRMRNALAQGN